MLLIKHITRPTEAIIDEVVLNVLLRTAKTMIPATSPEARTSLSSSS